MIDLILDAVKVVVSEDARKSASALIDFVKNSPGWKDDISTLEAKVPKRYEEQSFLLSDLTVSKLSRLEYSNAAIAAFKTIYSELVRNAFEHGCKKDTDRIKIILEITNVYVSVSVINPFSRKVHINRILNEKINISNLATRGRGLRLCHDLADSIMPISRNLGIKAVVYKDRIEFDVKTSDDVMIIDILNGENNPALVTKLEMITTKHPDKRIIFHFHTDTGVRSTQPLRLITKINIKNLNLPAYLPKSSDFLEDEFETQDNIRAVILFLGKIDSVFYLHDKLIARTWEDAFTKIGRPSLYHVFFPEEKFDWHEDFQDHHDNDDDDAKNEFDPSDPANQIW